MPNTPAQARFATRLAGVLCLAGAAAGQSLALEERPADWDANKACEQRICSIILERKPAGDDLSCALAKTWPKTTLKGGESKLVKWGFGDARCELQLNMSRDVMLKALTLPSYALEVPEHAVKCVVESDGKMEPVEVSLAPRIEFKNGRADKVWVNLKNATGPSSITATVKTAASLEDTLGLFHKSMIKGINKFVHKQCDERWGPGAAAYAAKQEAKRLKKEAAKAAKDGNTKASGETEAEAKSEPKETIAATVPAPKPEPAKPAQAGEVQTPATAAPERKDSQPSAPAKEVAATPPTPAAAEKAPEPKPSPAPGDRTSPAEAAKRQAARAAAQKPKKSAPVQMELRTTAPWDLSTPPPKGQ